MLSYYHMVSPPNSYLNSAFKRLPHCPPQICSLEGGVVHERTTVVHVHSSFALLSYGFLGQITAWDDQITKLLQVPGEWCWLRSFKVEKANTEPEYTSMSSKINFHFQRDQLATMRLVGLLKCWCHTGHGRLIFGLRCYQVEYSAATVVN